MQSDQDLVPIHSRHAQVAQHHIDVRASNGLQPLDSISRRDHLSTEPLEDGAGGFPGIIRIDNPELFSRGYGWAIP